MAPLRGVDCALVWFGVLFAGVVDGQNVWRTDLDPALDVLTRLSERGPVSMTTSCSLLHAPHASENEPSLVNDPELRSWLSFGKKKVQEVALLGRLLATSGDATAAYEPEDAEALARAPSANDDRVVYVCEKRDAPPAQRHAHWSTHHVGLVLCA